MVALFLCIAIFAQAHAVPQGRQSGQTVGIKPYVRDAEPTDPVCPPAMLTFGENQVEDGCLGKPNKTEISFQVDVDVGTCGQISFLEISPCTRRRRAERLVKKARRCLEKNMSECDDVPFNQTQACGEGTAQKCCKECKIEVLAPTS